jgi:hypothetical protein
VDVRDLPPVGRNALARDSPALPLNDPFVNRVEAGECPEQQRLSRSRRPKNR